MRRCLYLALTGLLALLVSCGGGNSTCTPSIGSTCGSGSSSSGGGTTTATPKVTVTTTSTTVSTANPATITATVTDA